MRKVKRSSLAAIGVLLVGLIAAACGTSSSSSNSTQYTPAGVATAGPGLTVPTKPSGAKVSGGTVYFTEGSDTPPNYIFPMTSAQVCSEANIAQLIEMLYRPLYWYGNNYTPTIDYDYSLAKPPTFSNGNTTVTVKLKSGWKWADGEPVSSRDVIFWMNLYKASPATNYCGYVPGRFPDNVTSYSAPDASTVVFHLNKAYNPEWFTYNELSQIFPLPLAWDRTSLSQPAPTTDNGHLPDAGGASSAEAVYKFLDTQSKNLGGWASSPLWSVVDGPFKLSQFTSSGQFTLVPNPSYSGSPKPSISSFVGLPFTSEAAIFNLMRSGGTKQVTVGTVPPQYAPQIPSLAKSEGFVDNKAAYYGFNYFPLNFNSNTPSGAGGGPVGYIFQQLYFRQALQHLVDQDGWINAFLYHTADPTYSPIPIAPPSPLASVSAFKTNPFPFSTSAASQLLSSHGWKVVPGGTTTCQNPSLCGTGIKKGEGISFNIDYLSGVLSTQDEMQDLASTAKKVGINISLSTHPFDQVIGTAVACPMSAKSCSWVAENWGAGWIYSPDYLPTGESLFAPGAVANYGSYVSPPSTSLINQTIFAPSGQEKSILTNYAKNIEMQVPVVYGPTELGTYGAGAGIMVDKKLGGYTANAFGNMNPENWYFTK